MVIKLDLKKAFDKLEWPFIRDMLHSINLPPKLIKIILSCISSSQLAILVNGQPTNFFEPTRGVRQGDPLSPYLFILGMKFLSLLIIYDNISSGNWTPISLSSNGPSISHTHFADDVFLFAESTESNALSIKNTLQKFMKHNSLSINNLKSIIYFSDNCHSTTCNNISSILSIKQTSNLGLY